MSQLKENPTTGEYDNTKKEENQTANMLGTIMFCITVLRKNWRWFALSAIVCLGLAYLYTKRQPRAYNQSATILIKEGDTKNNRSKAFNSLQDIGGIQTTDNLKDEIFILTSRRLMGVVVDQLKLNISYSVSQNLTPVTLFENSPIVAEFLEQKTEPFTFDAEIKGSKILIKNARIRGNKTGFEKTVTFDEPVKTPGGILLLKKTKYLKEFNNKTIRVTRTSRENAINYFRGCISASENNKEANLITIVCHDMNDKRANRILNCLLEAYKTDIVDAKNTVANNTAKFIEERIKLIGKQLSDVEKELVNFTCQTTLPRVPLHTRPFWNLKQDKLWLRRYVTSSMPTLPLRANSFLYWEHWVTPIWSSRLTNTTPLWLNETTCS